MGLWHVVRQCSWPFIRCARAMGGRGCTGGAGSRQEQPLSAGHQGQGGVLYTEGLPRAGTHTRSSCGDRGAHHGAGGPALPPYSAREVKGLLAGERLLTGQRPGSRALRGQGQGQGGEEVRGAGQGSSAAGRVLAGQQIELPPPQAADRQPLLIAVAPSPHSEAGGAGRVR